MGVVSERDIEKLAEDLGRIEDGIECKSCGSMFVPLDEKDILCKTCLLKLHREFTLTMKDFLSRISEREWIVRDARNLVERYYSHTGKKPCRKDNSKETSPDKASG